MELTVTTLIIVAISFSTFDVIAYWYLSRY